LINETYELTDKNQAARDRPAQWQWAPQFSSKRQSPRICEAYTRAIWALGDISAKDQFVPGALAAALDD